MCMGGGGSSKSRSSSSYSGARDGGNSNTFVQKKLKMAQPAPTPAPAPALEDPVEKERLRIQAEAVELQRQQLTFTKQQAAMADIRQRKLDELAARPDAIINNDQAKFLAGGQEGDGFAKEEEAVGSRRKGRRSLRIDLSGPQVPGSTGLNIPLG